jgi:acyl dehydratase
MKTNGLYLEDIAVGQAAVRSYAVTQEAIEAFAAVSGD